VLFCLDKSNGYAKEGRIPWHCSEDLRRFRRVTTACERPILLMGRKTYESMPASVFEGKRHACVLSHTVTLPVGNVTFCNTLERALYHCKSYDQTFLIGGPELIQSLIEHVATIDLTILEAEYGCDAMVRSDWMNSRHGWKLDTTEWMEDGRVLQYSRIVDPDQDERGYLRLMSMCLTNGIKKQDRTGIGRHSIFGHQLDFHLQNGFPLLTTKKVYWKGVVQELIWFLNGETSVKKLQEVGVHIWDGNSTREFMDSIGITDREEGDIGPCYGWQWRHFGAKYIDCHTDYSDQGVDQIEMIVKELQENPNSSRAVMSAWNAADLDKMNLPPCHVLYQFSLNGGRMNLHMYQRSADVFLGLPFNIASSALLCHIMASILEVGVGTLHISIGDAHVYDNHVEQCFKQLERVPRMPCSLSLARKLTLEDISTLCASDFKLVNYDPYPVIKGDMAV